DPMTSPALADADLDQFVEVFEAARRHHAAADLGPFLPPPGHPLYLPVLRELVRVDLDYGWAGGAPTPLAEYRRRFPALFADAATARAVVWEDYRQRRLAGEEPDPADYRREYGVSPLGDGEDGPRTDAVAVTPADGEDRDPPPTQVVCDAGPVAPAAAKPGAGSNRRSGEFWADRLDALGTGATPGAADLYREA